jgi:hypothetical protein
LRATVSFSLGWSPESAAGISQVCRRGLHVSFCVTLILVLLEWIFSNASQIAKTDIADDFVQSFSKIGVNALVACVMAIICITALNLACEHTA